jgi:hypothetical protein
MQSFLSRLSNVLQLVSSIKEIFQEIHNSKIKHDKGLLFQYLQQHKLTIKLMAEVSSLIRTIGTHSAYSVKQRASHKHLTRISYTNTLYASKASSPRLTYHQCPPLKELFAIMAETLDYPDKVVAQNSKKEVTHSID